MFKKIISLIVVATFFIACGGTDTNEPNTPTDNFDRGALLKNIAENIIIPSFDNFDTKLKTLKTKTTAFTSNPTNGTLTEVRTAWLEAYKAWQYVEMFNIGKAEELQFLSHFNIYPVTVADIEANVVAGTYDLNHSNNHDAQGFPALDYLFYGVANSDNEIIAKFSTDANATNYKKYLTDIITKMTTVTTAIVNDWKGSYKNTFISSTDNTKTSSLNKLVNDFIYYYEKGFRANKFGIPAGNWSPTPLPEKVEAFYKKDVSKELASEAFKAVQNFFEGKKFGGATTGQSFKTYLEYLKRQDLVSKLESQWKIADTQLNTLNNNFYQQITTDNTQMTKAYDEFQKAVVLLKVDMLQAFNVIVDYRDADGD